MHAGPETPAPSTPPLSLCKRIVFALIMLLLSLLILEGFFRVAQAVKRRLAPNERVYDDRLGWRTAAQYRSEDTFSPQYGRVLYTTGAHGFRLEAAPDDPRPRILVVGDSVTQARKVPDGSTYMDELARALDAAVFAYGSGGYGTLQEWMILEEHLDRVRPALVILQMSENDLINNTHAMESRSRVNVNHMTRPYWQGGQVVMRYPCADGMGAAVLRSSEVLRWVSIWASARDARRRGPAEVDRLPADDPRVRESVEVTADLLGRIRARCAPVPVVAFCAGNRGGNPGIPLLREACERAGVPFCDTLPAAIEAEAARGGVLNGMPEDPHWNAEGSLLAGRKLAEWLKERGLVPAAGSTAKP